MNQTPQNDGVIRVAEEKYDNVNAAANKFNIWSGDQAQSFYSKIVVQKLKIGAVTSAALFCISMFTGAILVTPWLDVVSFQIPTPFFHLFIFFQRFFLDY